MPDEAPFIVGTPSFVQAVTEVEKRLSELPLGARRLSAREIAGWRAREAAVGWELRVGFPDAERCLLVLVRDCFPFDMPRIVLVDRPDFLVWPHVEADGSLCIGDALDSPSVTNPAAVVLERLGAAAQLVEDLVAGRLDAHLSDEFLTYWLHDADDAGPPILSLLDPRGPSRVVHVWHGEEFRLVGESAEVISTWLRNRLGYRRRRPFRTQAALLAWLSLPPKPPYPRKGSDVRALIQGDDAASAALTDILRARPERCEIILGVTCAEGPALAGVTLSRPPKLRGRVDTVTKGFRPGAVPPKIFTDRFMASGVVTRSVVRRVDPSWVHGRGLDPRQARLSAANVAIVGCGSVGAPIAVALARAGVGRLLLVDGDGFATANVGRHPLGMGSIGLPKASALAGRIGLDCPHLQVSAYDGEVEQLLGADRASFAGFDLVVSATAHWPAEAMLDAFQAAIPGFPPVVYGWTEAHASAGHGVAIFASGARLVEGFESTGHPQFEVTAWPDGATTTRAEPACSGRFQPYGPVELGFVTGMVAELALDVLLDVVEAPTHRIWVARRARIEAMGGRWSEVWASEASSNLDGALMVERPWPPLPQSERSELAAA